MNALSTAEEIREFLIVRNEAVWTGRAERLLEDALSALRDETAPLDEVFSAAGAAIVCLRIMDRSAPEDELDGYPFPGEEEEYERMWCTCPPDLRARGGFTSSCPVHGLPS